MRTSDLILMGLRNLLRRKARTVLTVLGVVIGSLSIITMRSIGYGMKENFKKQVMEQGGLTTISVYSDAAILDENKEYVDSKKQKLDDRLVDKIREMKHVRAVTPVIRVYANLTTRKYEGMANIMVMDSEVFDDFDFPALSYGEYPTDEDRSVIIFGANEPYIYQNTRSMDKVELDLQKEKLKMTFEKRDYKIAKGKKEFFLPLQNVAKMVETEGDYDGSTYMDRKYFEKIYRQFCSTLEVADRKKAILKLKEYDEIKLNIDNIDNIMGVQKQIKELGFESDSYVEMLEPIKKSSDTLQMVLGALGLVAMLVSAISIANTMVMSIYERTKEIGVMKVLGCVLRDIRKLFLFEAGMIGLIGGIIGIILGYIASLLINKFGQPLFGSLMSGNAIMQKSENTTFSIIPIWLPFGALAIAVGIGLLSGYFPAKRATKISALEAMKTEG